MSTAIWMRYPERFRFPDRILLFSDAEVPQWDLYMANTKSESPHAPVKWHPEWCARPDQNGGALDSNRDYNHKETLGLKRCDLRQNHSHSAVPALWIAMAHSWRV